MLDASHTLDWSRGVRGTILSTKPGLSLARAGSADSADHLLQTHKKMAEKAINYILLCPAPQYLSRG